MGVDFDPEAVRTLREAKLPVQFGDAEDPGFLESLPLGKARWVVSSLPLWEANRGLLHALKEVGYKGQVAAVARDPAHRRQLEAAGLALVLSPFDDAADHAARGLGADILNARTQEQIP